jgi:hypothetical protein
LQQQQQALLQRCAPASADLESPYQLLLLQVRLPCLLLHGPCQQPACCAAQLQQQLAMLLPLSHHHLHHPQQQQQQLLCCEA